MLGAADLVDPLEPGRAVREELGGPAGTPP